MANQTPGTLATPHTIEMKINELGRPSRLRNIMILPTFSAKEIAASVEMMAYAVIPMAVKNAKTITPDPGTILFKNP